MPTGGEPHPKVHRDPPACAGVPRANDSQFLRRAASFQETSGAAARSHCMMSGVKRFLGEPLAYWGRAIWGVQILDVCGNSGATTKVNRRDFVMAVLSTSHGREWTPVQVQKIFFLLDKKIGDRNGGPLWNFSAYDYGPFDAAVYDEIENLERSGDGVVNRPPLGGMRTFALTQTGQGKGESLLRTLPFASYIEALSNWVRNLSFDQLVSAVYKEFPEMRQNSIFRE